MKPKAVVYCRESTLSMLPTDVKFDNQEADCRDYAKQQGYEVIKVYRESHSGADLLNRIKIWEAIDDVRRGEAQRLLVRNYDRLARKPEHQAVILYEVEEKHRGKVESALDPLDPEDINAKTTRGILAVVAEAERLNSVARMQRGTRKRAERGELLASATPLFGYRWADDEPGKKTTYIEDPDTAPIVKRIFHLVLSGQSLRAIARLFNAESVPTPATWAQRKGHGGRRKVGDEWKIGAVLRIVRNRTYTGQALAFNEVSICVPALVDTQSYDAAQRSTVAETIGRPPVDQEATWLRRHVFCGVCGARMVPKRSSNGTRQYRYQCCKQRSVSTSLTPCPGGDFSVNVAQLDPPVYDALCYILMRREQVAQTLLNRMGTEKVQALIAMTEAYESQLKSKREEMATARRRATQTSDDDLALEFISDAERLLGEIRALEFEYDGAKESLENFAATNAWIESTLQRIYDRNPIREIPKPEDVRSLPYEEKRLLLAATGLRAEVYPKGWPGHERIEVFFSWELTPSGYGQCHLLTIRHPFDLGETN